MYVTIKDKFSIQQLLYRDIRLHYVLQFDDNDSATIRQLLFYDFMQVVVNFDKTCFNVNKIKKIQST